MLHVHTTCGNFDHWPDHLDPPNQQQEVIVVNEFILLKGILSHRRQQHEGPIVIHGEVSWVVRYAEKTYDILILPLKERLMTCRVSSHGFRTKCANDHLRRQSQYSYDIIHFLGCPLGYEVDVGSARGRRSSSTSTMTKYPPSTLFIKSDALGSCSNTNGSSVGGGTPSYESIETISMMLRVRSDHVTQGALMLRSVWRRKINRSSWCVAA